MLNVGAGAQKPIPMEFGVQYQYSVYKPGGFGVVQARVERQMLGATRDRKLPM
jgi:hypothetical protein